MDSTPPGYVRLFHVTPAKNAKSILKHGLRCRKSQGKYRRIWLCDAQRLNWALVHVSRHHKTTPDRMRVFTAEVSYAALKMIRDGVCVTHYDLPAACLNLTA